MTDREEDPGFPEPGHWPHRPIRDLGLAIAGSPLEPVVAEFLREIDAVGLSKLRPRLYLSTEWGVPEGTVAIAIPFYLARRELTSLQDERMGHVEGTTPVDILRYLRHEMGHVVNYAYQLFETEEWVGLFGPMTRPYLDEYRAEPFSSHFVRHLPGWYAQKHPDEDWAETFAVWMTPGSSWREEYADRPVALAKLLYCDRTVAAIRGRDPLVAAEDLDEDVAEIAYSIDTFYRNQSTSHVPLPPGLDGALRALFDDLEPGDSASTRASAVIARHANALAVAVYRWTGHPPERVLAMLREFAKRADALDQVCPSSHEAAVLIGLSCLLTTLALNHVRTGSYTPTGPHPGDETGANVLG